MNIKYTPAQIKSALKWLKDCVSDGHDKGCTIKDQQILFHTEWPEYLFIKHKKIEFLQSEGDYETTIIYQLIKADGTRIMLSEEWPDRTTRAGIIGDMMPISVSSLKS